MAIHGVVYGIIFDNYKLDEFKKHLNDNDIKDFEVFSNTPETSLIKINVYEDKTQLIKNICQKVEFHFKQTN